MQSVLPALSWLNQVSSILNLVMESQGNLDRSIGNLSVASDMGNAKQQAAIQTNIEVLREQGRQISSTLYTRLGVTTLEEALVLVEDAKARLEKANQTFAEWRKILAAAEFLKARNQIVEEGQQGITQAQIDETIKGHEEDYFAALQLLEKSMPAEKRIILA